MSYQVIKTIHAKDHYDTTSSFVIESDEKYSDALLLAELHATEHAARLMVPCHNPIHGTWWLRTNNGTRVTYLVAFGNTEIDPPAFDASYN